MECGNYVGEIERKNLEQITPQRSISLTNQFDENVKMMRDAIGHSSDVIMKLKDDGDDQFRGMHVELKVNVKILEYGTKGTKN
ncbi:hypothetical protein B1748_10515 [Paenibacillus sp. MY03]|uniref:hypothetical protein n=1 Tax=Paenibacillus sp. MY03 TaxID=302980 RepID=UPI000B3C840E|nr:hypothetical protein [Paenibacillus sp. MY03]OUS76997.1 hypothetical protein B1748_10515 [Paenibacillus sp. MY03]